jgi:hypothetical protein
MAAGFQINIERGSFGFRAGAFNGNDFRVVPPRDSMESRGDDFSTPHQHRADYGIGAGSSRAFDGKTTSHAQIMLVQISPGAPGQNRYPLFDRLELVPGRPFRSLMSSSNSTMNSLMSLNER